MPHTPGPSVSSAPTSLVLRGISSMATKAILAELTAQYHQQTGVSVHIESVGGVDAAKRVQAGEAFDVVLLASDAIDRLTASGHVAQGSRHDWVNSPVAVAVRTGAIAPRIDTEAALKEAVMAAPSLSYSTGPSGVYLEKLFARWGVAEQLKPRIVVPPPGTPVGALVAQGQAALGFQQLSEFIGVPGVTVVGQLPAEVAFITTFSAGLPIALTRDVARKQAVKAFLEFLTSPEVGAIKQRQGMTWPH
jgi:molybdate transport system substrate-binding protein